MDTTEEVNDKQQSVETICEQFEGIIDCLSNFKVQMNALQQQLKALEKTVKKQLTCLQKEITKNKNKNKGNRKPSGFAKPSKVTSELCEFMNKKEGTEIARTEVTKALCTYIKEHNLENKDNSKFIYPDNKLKTLLGLEEGQELTYFTIQKFMNKHFI
jgi:chromatin remodeling complex protein RSC6